MSKRVLEAPDIDRILTRIAHEIIERHGAESLPAIIGIRTCGEYLAKRLCQKIENISKKKTLYGVLDINLYRDDFTRTSETPSIRETIIDFDIDDKTVVLVDDVLYTGRTIRCALDALMDFGRPKVIQLAVLVDRGHRELPIKADYIGKNIPTASDEIIQVHLMEKDSVDDVVLESGEGET